MHPGAGIRGLESPLRIVRVSIGSEFNLHVTQTEFKTMGGLLAESIEMR